LRPVILTEKQRKPMSEFQIIHNPRCSKSRQTLAILEEKGIEPEIILYLQNPLTKAEIKSIVAKLGLSLRDLIRSSEDAYKEKGLQDSSLSDEQLLQAIIDEPKLLQRPIVIKGDKAVIGRPPENVLELI
jgi:arsenate reductase